jgi:arylsulfatase A-like enzyme
MTPTSAIKRREFISTVAAGSIALTAPAWMRGQAPHIARRHAPNILFLNTDQWHAEVFSHRGNPWLRTPNSDRIMAAGLSFDRAYAAHPVCTPARTSWLTGRMPAEHNLRPPASMPDMGQWFSRHGYETVHFGKWDVGGRNVNRSMDLGRTGHALGQYCDHAVAEMARSYLLGRRRDKPYFMHVGIMNPHDICQPAVLATQRGRIAWDGIELPPLPDNFAARPDEPRPLSVRLRRSPRRAAHLTWDEHDWRVYQYIYYRFCEMADAAVGIILDTLEASGEAENTLLVYTSDHGEGRGEHGLTTKGFLYDSSVRVPLTLVRPGHFAAGTRNNHQFVSGVDFFPAFCGVAGIPQPDNLTGVDFIAETLAGRRSREAVVAQASFDAWMVRTDRYKYIRYEAAPEAQLFDLLNDPGETRSLARDSGSSRLVSQHEVLLTDFRSRLRPA